MLYLFGLLLVLVLKRHCNLVDGIASFLEKPVYGDGENDESNAVKKDYYFSLLNKMNGAASFPEEIQFRQPAGEIFQVSSMSTGECSIFYPVQMEFSPSSISLKELNCSNQRSIGEWRFLPSVVSRNPPTVVALDSSPDSNDVYGVIGNDLVQVSLNSSSKIATYKTLGSLIDSNCDFVQTGRFTGSTYTVLCGSGFTWDSSYFIQFDTSSWVRKSSWKVSEKIHGIEYFQEKIYGLYESDSGYFFGYTGASSISSTMSSLIKFNNIYGFLGTAIHSNMFYGFIAGEEGQGPYSLGIYYFVFDMLKEKQFMFQRVYDSEDYRYDVGGYMKYIYFWS